MTFPHGCGDHHFLYLKKLFRREPVPALFREDEAHLMKAGWLCRNADGMPEVTEPVAAYFIAARRPPNEAGKRRTVEDLMHERLQPDPPLRRRRLELVRA